VLCPVNAAEDRRDERRRANDLRQSLTALMPILSDCGILGLVEPLGFSESSLRLKRVAIEAIDGVGGNAAYKLVHDTFHHKLAAEDQLFPERTGLVHISGVEDASLALEAIQDKDRVLVGSADLLDTVGQVRALLDGGYHGPFSFEPFSPDVHGLADRAGALRESMAFIRRAAAA
jgi:2-keto-myo-inositol isomerase